MYELLLYLHNKDIYSCKWILCIQKILQDVGLNYIWIAKTVSNINWPCFSREVKDRLEMSSCKSGTLMSKTAQNASTIEFLKQNLKLKLTLQNFSPVHISLYTTLTNFSTKYLVMCKVYTDVGGIK